MFTVKMITAIINRFEKIAQFMEKQFVCGLFGRLIFMQGLPISYVCAPYIMMKEDAKSSFTNQTIAIVLVSVLFLSQVAFSWILINNKG
jgi:hypothetical protein